MSLLDITVDTGMSGPVMKLSGECDFTTTGQLRDAIGAQISDGARYLALDLSQLRFADSMTFKLFLDAHNSLKKAGGTFELLRPQGEVARLLHLLGVDQLFTIRTEAP